MHTYAHVCAHMNACVCICMHMRTYQHMCMHACMHEQYTYIQVYRCVHMCIHTHAYAYVCICMHMYAYMPIHGPPGGERGKDTRRDVGGGAGKTEGWNIYTAIPIFPELHRQEQHLSTPLYISLYVCSHRLCPYICICTFYQVLTNMQHLHVG